MQSHSRSDSRCNPLWRGSLLPLGCEAAPTATTQYIRHTPSAGFRVASQPSGSKLPRHNSSPAFLAVLEKPTKTIGDS
ncbi:hypothetical protein C0J56_13650 [Pseudomonas fluorescens]|nr:hypothetical protein C0J56_13650 [Pseudomonas fluorescens]